MKKGELKNVQNQIISANTLNFKSFINYWVKRMKKQYCPNI